MDSRRVPGPRWGEGNQRLEAAPAAERAANRAQRPGRQRDLGGRSTRPDDGNLEQNRPVHCQFTERTPEGPQPRVIAATASRQRFVQIVVKSRKKIVEAAALAKLPSACGFREFVDSGGLMSYGASISESYRRAAVYIDKILKGAKPADLPVEQPMKLELVINLKTAKALGLTIPPSVLARADELIQ